MLKFLTNKSLRNHFLNHQLFTSILLIITTLSGTSPAKAQPQLIPFLPQLNDTDSWLPQNSSERNVTTCIRLDGRCVFTITYPKSKIRERVDVINTRLDRIGELYFSQENYDLEITTKGQKKS